MAIVSSMYLLEEDHLLLIDSNGNVKFLRLCCGAVLIIILLSNKCYELHMS